MFVFDYLVYFTFDVKNAESCSSFQSNLLVLDSGFFFNRGRGGSENFARFGINLVRWWTLPRKDRSCFNVLGLSSLVMASVFVISGFIPLRFIVKPSHSKLVFANSRFCRLIARPSLFSFLNILSNSFSCSRIDPLMITRISSRNANFEEMPSSVFFEM